MTPIDEYTARGANEIARTLNGPEAAAALIASAIAGNTHYPANGARVVVGWADRSGAMWVMDHPVLWFDADGYPVVADTETGLGLDTLKPHYALGGASNERWSVYHPDRVVLGGEPNLSARDEATSRVAEALAEFVSIEQKRDAS